MTPVVALTIAGTDSAGGAGLHADVRTFSAHGVHAASAIAALTAQSTEGIRGVHLVPTGFVAAQIGAVLDDLDVRATKTGFLGSAHTVAAVADLAAGGRLRNLVVDPVLVRTDGTRLFGSEVERAYRSRLLPLARVVTPNRVEAGVLVDGPVESVADMRAAAVELAAAGPVVVVTGADATDEGEEAIDVVAWPDGGVTELRLPMIETGNDHGSGCSFSAAVAARLALGHGIETALDGAKRFVHDGLRGGSGWRVGAGHGPLDHFGWNATPVDRAP